MINKLIEIKNFGTFNNFKGTQTDWHGVFNKNNIIYAPNGTGKTSLSIIFQSLEKRNNEIIIKKKRIQSTSNPIIRLLVNDENQSCITFDNDKWSEDYKEISVFNSFYFSNNIYTFTASDAFLEQLYLDENVKKTKKNLNQKIKEIENKKKYRKDCKNWINYYKKTKDENIRVHNLNRYNRTMSQLGKQIGKLNEEISTLKIPIETKFKEISVSYCDIVNNILKQFTDSIVINEVNPVFNNKCNIRSVIFSLTIDGIETNLTDRNELSFDFILSDGDKSAIAFASFISHLKMFPSIANRLVVIDDPFTSFDENRRQKTIDIISDLSVQVKQLFVLTHDLDFGHKLSQRIYPKNSLLTLELFKKNKESNIKKIDFEKETLTGVIKHVSVLYNFLKEGANSQEELENVKRNIRLSLEGMFKIKFFEYNNNNTWLGSFLEFIEKSVSDTNYKKFERLYPHIQKLRNINHYSSPAHHAGETNKVNSIELQAYVADTLELIDLI